MRVHDKAQEQHLLMGLNNLLTHLVLVASNDHWFDTVDYSPQTAGLNNFAPLVAVADRLFG